MKYANNHPDKFADGKWWIPFAAGLMQTTMVFAIETVNLINICAQVTIIEIVSNYVVFAVVADFDDLICNAITRNDKISKLFDENILKF